VPEVPELPVHDHGGDVVAVARSLGVPPESVLDLSANMNPAAPDVARLAVAHLGALSRYPDPTVVGDATAVLAAAIGVSEDRLLLTNGAAEAIALVAAEEPAGEVVEPEFSLYRRSLQRVEAGAPRWRSNPNNPLGTLAGPDEQAAVWDESFWPLATGTWTRGDEGSYRIGSLTKLWSCPGLRLGYVIALDAATRARLAARQPAWSVNGLALALIPELLERTDLVRWAGIVASLRADLVDLWAALGYEPIPSAADWVLVPEALHLRAPLARLGVLVRDCTNFGLGDTIRVAVPDGTGLLRLADALVAVT
jgi:histidinol-phosphate/aromatic aminotransferase/cobyric acid decarboxylase-like protein